MSGRSLVGDLGFYPERAAEANPTRAAIISGFVAFVRLSIRGAETLAQGSGASSLGRGLGESCFQSLGGNRHVLLEYLQAFIEQSDHLSG